MDKKFEQREYAAPWRIVDRFSADTLYGDRVLQFVETAELGERMERFTGQTYLVRIS